MKAMAAAALCALLLAGCESKDPRLDELQKDNEALAQRVKSLEDHLLEAQKQLVAQQQALQTINARQRDMENFFNKLQVGAQYGTP